MSRSQKVVLLLRPLVLPSFSLTDRPTLVRLVDNCKNIIALKIHDFFVSSIFRRDGCSGKRRRCSAGGERAAYHPGRPTRRRQREAQTLRSGRGGSGAATAAGGLLGLVLW